MTIGVDLSVCGNCIGNTIQKATPSVCLEPGNDPFLSSSKQSNLNSELIYGTENSIRLIPVRI